MVQPKQQQQQDQDQKQIIQNDKNTKKDSHHSSFKLLQIRKSAKEYVEQKRLTKRIERRMWYDYYLKPYSMIVQKNDLFFADQRHIQGNDTKDVDTATIQAPTHLLLPPSTTSPGCCGRVVTATCALCIDDNVYKDGDTVVWSSSGLPQQQQQSKCCSHVYHKSCVMEQCLTKGKKHCPICRKLYVPRQKIDDQKIFHGESWIRALKEMTMTEQQHANKQQNNDKKEKNDEIEFSEASTKESLSSSVSLLSSLSSSSQQQH